MNKGVSFEISHSPVAKGRPRFTRAGRAYTPKKTKDYEEFVRAYLASQIRSKDFPLNKGYRVALNLTFYLPIPKSFSKKKRQAAIDEEIMPVTRPDVDNYIKVIVDGMNGIIFEDDSQVVCIHAHKRYSDAPRTDVLLEWKPNA